MIRTTGAQCGKSGRNDDLAEVADVDDGGGEIELQFCAALFVDDARVDAEVGGGAGEGVFGLGGGGGGEGGGGGDAHNGAEFEEFWGDGGGVVGSDLAAKGTLLIFVLALMTAMGGLWVGSWCCGISVSMRW